MDNQQLRTLAADLLGTLDEVVPDAARRAVVSDNIGAALAATDIDVLRRALSRDPDVRTWLLARSISIDRFTSLAGDRTSRQDVMYRCPRDGFEDTFDTVPLEPPECPDCGQPMTIVDG